MDSVLANLGCPSEYDVRVEMRPRQLKARIRGHLVELIRLSGGGAPWMAEFARTQLLEGRRRSVVAERMAFLAGYLIASPSNLAVRLLYARLEPWGA